MGWGRDTSFFQEKRNFGKGKQQESSQGLRITPRLGHQVPIDHRGRALCGGRRCGTPSKELGG